jgi:hypothetical protein
MATSALAGVQLNREEVRRAVIRRLALLHGSSSLG